MSREDNQCGGKIKYQTYEDAHAAAANLNKRGKRKMGTYKCSECNLYHVGNNQRANKSKAPKNVDYKKYDHESKVHTANKRFIKNK